MGKTQSPYAGMAPQAFWRSGVRDPGIYGLTDLWSSRWQLPSDARFATFGSCFAQHISRALRERGLGWVNGEPAPAGTPASLARLYNYGVFSARTANIYSSAHLLWLLEMACGQRSVESAEIWPDGKRWRDSLRPVIEPDGFADRDEALASRQAMLNGLRAAITGADVFVFTLGLTKGWSHVQGQPYAVCPGTLAGQFDPAQHRFSNARMAGIRDQLLQSLRLLQQLNPGLRLLLTVSPVPLTATASGAHALVATTRSKSVLRSVAAELTEDFEEIDYFPSYELITGGPTRGAFWEPDLRTVAAPGVSLVMDHFFKGLRLSGPPAHSDQRKKETEKQAAFSSYIEEQHLVCEEYMAGVSNV